MESVHYPINGELDLHAFHPKEIKGLIRGYIEACREKDIYQIRIIHGKGKGVLRQMVHKILDNEKNVHSYWQEGSAGGWGATIVKLKK
jgi:DNA-nicking Smr family endonuclease